MLLKFLILCKRLHSFKKMFNQNIFYFSCWKKGCCIHFLMLLCLVVSSQRLLVPKGHTMTSLVDIYSPRGLRELLCLPIKRISHYYQRHYEISMGLLSLLEAITQASHKGRSQHVHLNDLIFIICKYIL